MRFRNYLFGFIVFAFLPFVVFAQSMAVTAILVDSDGQSWNNGTYSVQLSGANYYYNGTLVPNTIQSGTLSATGGLSVNLYNTNTLTPVGSAVYNWTICSNTSAPCSVFSTPVTTTNLSSLLSSLITAPRFIAGPTAYGYTTVEVITPILIGAQFFNVLYNKTYTWNGTNWYSLGVIGFVSFNMPASPLGISSVNTCAGTYSGYCTPLVGNGVIYSNNAVSAGGNVLTVSWTIPAGTFISLGKPQCLVVGEGSSYAYGLSISANTTSFSITTTNAIAANASIYYSYNCTF